MTDRERLTKHWGNNCVATKLNYDFLLSLPNIEVKNFNAIIQKLAHYEDLEEQGKIIVLPCKVGDTVYVITDCSQIIKHFDNDYVTGTGAIECLFEDVCKFEECNDINTQVLETYVIFLLCDEYDDWTFRCEDINRTFSFSDFGKTVFLTREEAEKALAERQRKS